MKFESKIFLYCSSKEKKKKKKVAAALICLPHLSYSPLHSPLRNDIFLFIVLPDSKNASFPVLLHQLLHG